MLRCHSKNEINYKQDDSTPVCCAAFLPDEIGKETVVCTGGAHKVCFITCKTGKVEKIFQATPDLESFYCLAATFLQNYTSTEGGKAEDVALVAAAGSFFFFSSETAVS